MNMPDSVIPYLDKTVRGECLELYKMKAKSGAANKLKGTTTLDTLTTDFIQARVSDACLMQIKALCSHSGDTVLCVIKTYLGPQKESAVTLYTRQWKCLQNLTFCIDSLLYKPDTMSESRYKEIRNAVDHYFIECRMQAHESFIWVNANTDMNFMNEGKNFLSICRTRKYKWNGRTFE